MATCSRATRRMRGCIACSSRRRRRLEVADRHAEGAGEGQLNWSESSVLVTGGTGSVGHKVLGTMLAKYHPRPHVMFSRAELRQPEVMKRFDDPSLRVFIR